MSGLFEIIKGNVQEKIGRQKGLQALLLAISEKLEEKDPLKQSINEFQFIYVAGAVGVALDPDPKCIPTDFAVAGNILAQILEHPKASELKLAIIDFFGFDQAQADFIFLQILDSLSPAGRQEDFLRKIIADEIKAYQEKYYSRTQGFFEKTIHSLCHGRAGRERAEGLAQKLKDARFNLVDFIGDVLEIPEGSELKSRLVKKLCVIFGRISPAVSISTPKQGPLLLDYVQAVQASLGRISFKADILKI